MKTDFENDLVADGEELIFKGTDVWFPSRAFLQDWYVLNHPPSRLTIRISFFIADIKMIPKRCLKEIWAILQTSIPYAAPAEENVVFQQLNLHCCVPVKPLGFSLCSPELDTQLVIYGPGRFLDPSRWTPELRHRQSADENETIFACRRMCGVQTMWQPGKTREKWIKTSTEQECGFLACRPELFLICTIHHMECLHANNHKSKVELWHL